MVVSDELESRYLRKLIALAAMSIAGFFALLILIVTYYSTVPGPGRCQALGESCGPAVPSAPTFTFWIAIGGCCALAAVGVTGMLLLRVRHGKIRANRGKAYGS